MSYSIKKNHKIAIKEEVTEGTYEAPSSGSDFIQAQEDGIEMNGSKDTLEVNVIGQGLSKAAPRVGLESATGSLGVYLKAGSTAGASPEYGLMMESLLGSKRSSTAITSGIGNTSSVINEGIEKAEVEADKLQELIEEVKYLKSQVESNERSILKIQEHFQMHDHLDDWKI